jgi:hypothetical protein
VVARYLDAHGDGAAFIEGPLSTAGHPINGPEQVKQGAFTEAN